MGTLKKIATIMFVAVLAGCAYFAWVISQPTEKSRPFDHVTWKQTTLLDTSNDPGCFRGGMALDIIDQDRLLGMSDPEVISLLGVPPNSSSGSWLYPVGQCGFLWGHHDLQVTFGADGKVKHADLADSK